MAEGWLWVSTFMQTPQWSSSATTPALSTNTERHQGRASFSVARTMVSLRRFP